MYAWHDFLVAVAGVSGALVGLLFVGLSINLDRLITLPHLLLRAGAALTLLVSTLLVSIFLLAPSYSIATHGLGTLVMGVVTWGLTTYMSVRSVQVSRAHEQRYQVVGLVLMQLATIPIVVAGYMVWHREEDGLSWLVPAFLLAFGVAMVNSWVLLVESRR